MLHWPRNRATLPSACFSSFRATLFRLYEREPPCVSPFENLKFAREFPFSLGEEPSTRASSRRSINGFHGPALSCLPNRRQTILRRFARHAREKEAFTRPKLSSFAINSRNRAEEPFASQEIAPRSLAGLPNGYRQTSPALCACSFPSLTHRSGRSIVLFTRRFHVNRFRPGKLLVCPDAAKSRRDGRRCWRTPTIRGGTRCSCTKA